MRMSLFRMWRYAAWGEKPLLRGRPSFSSKESGRLYFVFLFVALEAFWGFNVGHGDFHLPLQLVNRVNGIGNFDNFDVLLSCEGSRESTLMTNYEVSE